MLQNIINMMQE